MRGRDWLTFQFHHSFFVCLIGGWCHGYLNFYPLLFYWLPTYSSGDTLSFQIIFLSSLKNNPLKKQQQQQSFSKTTMIILTIHTLKTLPFDSLVASALTLWVPLVLNVFPLRARLSSRGDFICLSSQLVSPSSSCSHCLTFYFSMSSGAGSTGLGCFTNYT